MPKSKSIKKKVQSSNLEELEYFEDKNELVVTFKGGTRYKYFGVPKTVFDAIIDERFTNQKGQPSVGATFIKLVKNNPSYKFVKLDD